MKYQVIDSRTKEVVFSSPDRKKVRRALDRLDNAYGACVHYVVLSN